jgi:formamidopyrimidine-DNA glycosylase
MPELPEVETMRRGILPIVGGVITKVYEPGCRYRPIKLDPDLAQIQRRIVGKRIRSVDRIAKRVLVRLDSEDSVVLQPKMAGLVMISDPPSPQHTRLIFELSEVEVPQFLYWDRRGLGTVSVWTPAQLDCFLGPSQLGPDASLVSQSSFVERFRGVRRSVKVALLDQRLVCGIGNLYAAEILFAAQVHPESRCDELTQAQWKRIHSETIRILQLAIESEGSTLSDGTYRNSLNGEGSYQANHQVYDREGEACYRCKRTPIVRMVQAQRSTFFCPKCQRSK